MEGTRQKRKANVLPAEHYEAAVGGSAGSAGTAYMDLNIGPRVENGKIVPRHHLIFHTAKNKVIHLTVEESAPMQGIYKAIEECVGHAVTLHQKKKKKPVMLKRSDIAAEQGMHFGYSVLVQSVVPEKPTNPWIHVPRRHHYIPGVLRAGAPALAGVARAKDHVFGADENLVSAPDAADEEGEEAKSAKRAKSAKSA